MATKQYTHVVIGGGLAGASAVGGIRQHDTQGCVLLVGGEGQLPYDRPPLSKQLWSGQKQVADIFLHDRKYYDTTGVDLLLNTRVTTIDAKQKRVTLADGQSYRYEKLLLATGGTPRVLPISGGELPGVCYFRTLDDYRRLRDAATQGRSAVVIGGGFIGSEMAAALCANGVRVTMVFPAPYLCRQVFPETLGRALQANYQRKGVQILAQDTPTEITRRNSRYVVHTRGGESIESDLLVAGIGLMPALELATAAGLATGNGIVVNEYLQTTDPDIYAAGDNAFFPYHALGQSCRIEHWDHAFNQGQSAGRNMAGAHEPYTHMPFFFSDLFEFAYEAVGEVSAALTTFADWQDENRTGVVYYLRDDRVRGVLLCNVWEKVEQARAMIRGGERWPQEKLRGAIR